MVKIIPDSLRPISMIYFKSNVSGIDKLNQLNYIEIFYYINKSIDGMNTIILNFYIKIEILIVIIFYLIN